MSNISQAEFGARRMAFLLCMAALLMFSAFGLAASCAVLLFVPTQGVTDPPSAAKLAIKAALFLVILAGSAWGIFRGRSNAEVPATDPQRQSSLPFLIVILTAAALVAIPRLDKYPWLAPDELHHLTVARNLAQYGQYASGHPLTGMKQFDDYDSVGAPVLVPIAAAFRIAGTGTVPGRIVISAFFLLLCACAFLLVRQAGNSFGAAAGVLCMACGFGSIYLGRTLYGEVPGLAFVAAGLLAWRRGISDGARRYWLILAGLCLGLAALCKTVLVFASFAFLAAYVYDFATFRRLRLRHVGIPWFIAGCVIGAWLALKTFSAHSVAASGAATMAAYQHYLVFSLHSFFTGLAWITKEPSQWMAFTAAIWLVPTIFRRKYNPALAALWFLAIFYVYWWLFFTPARLPRYMWYTTAIDGCFAGVLIVHLATRRKPWAAIAAVLIACAFAWNGVGEIRRAWFTDELRDERALAEYVMRVDNRPVVTLSWPVAGLMNFLADRNLRVVAPEAVDKGAVVIVDRDMTERPVGVTPAKVFGRYDVYE